MRRTCVRSLIRPSSRGPVRAGLALLVAAAMMVVPIGTGTSALAQATALQVVPVSTQLWVGGSDLILQLFDAQSVPVVDAPASLVLTAPDGVARDPVPLVVRRFTPQGRHLHVGRVLLDQPGTWRADVTLERDTGPMRGLTDLVVRPDDGTPALGAPVPDVATPTLRDARNLLRSISSDPDPVPQFYVSSVSELLAAGLPFLLVFDSTVFRPNEACGGALAIIHEIYPEFPSLAIVHAEPWVTSYQTGMLTLDPPDGPAVLTPTAQAYGIDEPPWVFVVRRDGTLHAKLAGVLGTDELRAAMAAVTATAGVTD